MKNNRVFIGIDVSKATLDVFIHNNNQHFVVNNNLEGFVTLLEQSCKIAKCRCNSILVCFENTGSYSKLLSVFLHEQNIMFVMEPALKIKRSLGLTRGKNDKVDAKRIALYAYEKRESLEPTILPGAEIDKIKSLLSLREKLLKHRTAYKNGIKSLVDCYETGETNIIKESQKRLIENINSEIELIEKQIYSIIKKNPSLNKNYKLVISVKGIGKVNAFFLIAYTANFTLFKNARSFACYCGIAPFENSSGTIKGKTKIHHLGNKKLKSLLNMAATSAIKSKGELKLYYQKRVEQGKSKMSTINIVRNKILFRVFAVVNRGTPYVDLFKFAA